MLFFFLDIKHYKTFVTATNYDVTCQTRTHRARSSPSDGGCDPSSHHVARCVAAVQSGASRATSRPRRAAMLVVQLHLSRLREAHWPPWRASCAFATACASTASLAMMRRTPPRADDLLAWLRGRHRGVDGRGLSGHFERDRATARDTRLCMR